MAGYNENIITDAFILAVYIPTHLEKKLNEIPLQWRHNERDDVSNFRHLDCFDQWFVQAQIIENI